MYLLLMPYIVISCAYCIDAWRASRLSRILKPLLMPSLLMGYCFAARPVQPLIAIGIALGFVGDVALMLHGDWAFIAGLAGFLAVSVKPYIAQRFATWGHAWEDIYDKGFQQTRAMSAAASGGLYGKGAGGGWLKDIFAANTDMVFAVICEEQGLIIGLIMVLAVLVLAFFAVRSARRGRSAYYSIASCAAMSMLLVQLALNVFGSLDLLPFTGVTFPFVSRGGTSLISCWMLMAFIKSSDTRLNASFAVRPGRGKDDEEEGNTPASDNGFAPEDDPANWEVWQPCEK